MTDDERLARELLGVATEVLDLRPDPAQPSTAVEIDAAIERLADALIAWSDRLRGLDPPSRDRPDRGSPDPARVPRSAIRAELAAGTVPGDRHTIRAAATSLRSLARRAEAVGALSAPSSGAAQVCPAMRRLAAALDSHAELISSLRMPDGGSVTDTSIARRARQLDAAEDALAQIAATTLPG